MNPAHQATAGSRLVVACILVGGLAAGCHSKPKPAESKKPATKQARPQKIEAVAPVQKLESTPPVATNQPQDKQPSRELALRNFRPRSMLKVRQHLLTHARFPAVDVHTHFRLRFKHSRSMLDDFVAVMDRHNIAICVSLDGILGPELEAHQHYLWKQYRDRFVIFTTIDWIGSGDRQRPASWDCHRDDFVHRVVEQLRLAKEQGASGLKLFKQFGLAYRNPNGSLMKIDNPRWDPIWQVCGELGLPVIIHTADPAAFFQPIDRTNERWEELSRHPDWSFYGDDFPSRDELLAARNRVIARHPNTTFIGAHVANNPEDLETVSQWLQQYPNLVVEIASRIAELGRQPYTARRFFLRHRNRIMLGTDGPWPELRLTYYWRFLETFDENFPYSEKEFPPQGLWTIDGIGLPDEVLRKIYFENACRLIPGVKEKYERFVAGQTEGSGS